MNNDLISRKMAIDAIIDHIREKFAQRDTPLNYISGLYKAEDIIEILPSAERKKGEWEVAIGYDQNKKVMCTECRLMSYEPTPFCPNCGAEMVNSDE